MGLFGSSSKKDLNKLMKEMEKTKRIISIRCPRCGRVYNQPVYGNGSFQGRCNCGYTVTERDRY